MSKIVSVHSFRHGTGKSNLAANLAVQIAYQGKRVGIVDTSPQSLGIHTLFGLDSDRVDRVLNEYLWSNRSIAEVDPDNSPFLPMGNGEIAVMGGEICLIPSRVKVGEIAHLLQQGYDSQVLSQGLVELTKRLNLEVLLIDTYSGLGEEALLPLAVADALVLVLCLDPQEFQGTAVLVDLARKLGVPQIFLVANQVSSLFHTREVHHQLEAAYGDATVSVLPFADEMLLLASRDIFCLRYPDHAWSIELQQIAQRLSAVSGVGRSPSPQQLLSWIMLQGGASLAELIAYTGQDETQVRTTLAALIEQGFVQQLGESDGTKYQPCLTFQPDHSIAQVLEQRLEHSLEPEPLSESEPKPEK